MDSFEDEILFLRPSLITQSFVTRRQSVFHRASSESIIRQSVLNGKNLL
jgi:hypothetical protein